MTNGQRQISAVAYGDNCMKYCYVTVITYMMAVRNTKFISDKLNVVEIYISGNLTQTSPNIVNINL